VINIGFSITIFGVSYLDKFLKYTLPPILFFFNKSKKYKLILFLHSTKKEFDYINYLLSSSNINYLIEFHELNIKSIKNFSLKELTLLQNQDLQLSHDKSVKYLYFLYADMFFNFELIENTMHLLNKSPLLKGCYTFAPELENNNYLKNFYKYLKKDINKALKFLIDNYSNLISRFHKNYILGNGIPTNFNFLMIKENDTILIKSLSFHPIVVDVSLNKKNQFNSITIDFNFLFRNDIQKWLLINEMSKVCCFSISNKKNLRNHTRNFDKILTVEEAKNIYIANMQSNILKLSYYKKKIFYDKFIVISNNPNKSYILNNTFNKKLTERKDNFRYFIKILTNLSIKNLTLDILTLIYSKFFFKKKLYLKTIYQSKEIILLASIIRIFVKR
jgi:hypothetical protein